MSRDFHLAMNFVLFMLLHESGTASEEYMAWLWIIAGLLVAVFLSVQLGFLAPPHAVTLIRMRSGRQLVSKGTVRGYAKEQVAEVLEEAVVSRGHIAVTPCNRVAFSRTIPFAIHQQLRNIILNQ